MVKIKYTAIQRDSEIAIKTNGFNLAKSKEKARFMSREELERAKESMDEMDYLALAIEDCKYKLANNEAEEDLNIDWLNLMGDIPDEVYAVINKILTEKDDAQGVIGLLKNNPEVQATDKYTATAIQTFVHRVLTNKYYKEVNERTLKKLEGELQAKEDQKAGKTRE